MRLLLTLMVSMTLVTTSLLAHALATAGDPGPTVEQVAAR